MYPGTHAAARGAVPAVVVLDGPVLTHAALDDRSVRLARALRRRGLREGSTVAVVLENRVEFAETVWAALRTGLWVAPLNWHLTRADLLALLAGSRAEAVVTSPALLAGLAADPDEAAGHDVLGALRAVLVVGEGLGYETALAAEEGGPLDDERLGARLLYSGGSTGRPKAIRQPLPGIHPRDTPLRLGGLVARLGLDADAVFLNAAPMYHAAPFQFALITASLGATCVHLTRFDPEDYLRAVQAHRVTHAQVVPTMLVRLLRLPPEVRDRYDLSSLRVLVTSGAPCPPDLKDAATAWLGPVVHEYYGASEGYGQTHIGPDEVAAHRGSVGRPLVGSIHVTGDDGRDLAPGEVGRVWFAGTPAFSYEGDPAKTAGALDVARGRSTVGDLGYLDGDGYLYLVGREGDTIVSGGVNIHPREIEDVLALHPAVADVVVLGLPDPEYGEVVTAVVQPAAGTGEGLEAGPALAAELTDFVRDRLARFMAPRRVEFVDTLGRAANGKIDRRAVRARLTDPTTTPLHDTGASA